MTIPTEWVVFILGAIMTFLAWFGRGKIQQYDEHLLECNKRRIAEAATESATDLRIAAIEEAANKTERNVTWLGDCMISLGSAVKAHLPERPK